MAYTDDGSYYEYYEDDSGIELSNHEDNNDNDIIDWMENQEPSNERRTQLLLQHQQDEAQLTPSWRAVRTLHQFLLWILWCLFSPVRWTLAWIDNRLTSSNGQAYILSIHENGNLPHQTPYHRVIGVFTTLKAARTAMAEILGLPEYKERTFLGIHTPVWPESEIGSLVSCVGHADVGGRGGGAGMDGGFRFIVERMCVKWR